MACGAACAWDARFCQQCGRRLDERSPRYYGVLAPGPAFVLGSILFLAATVALVAGSLIPALLLFAIALVAFAFFYDTARRNPDDRLVRLIVSARQHLRAGLKFVLASISAWGHAARDVGRLRRESRSLRREREPMLRSLGVAVCQDDESLAKTLLERIREIDAELATREEARVEALAAARRHIEDEREAARPTQRLTADDVASGEGSGEDA